MGNRCFVPLTGGEINPITVPNPAAGANWSYTLPVSYEQEIRALECKLTCAAAAGNRAPKFQILSPGGAVLWEVAFSVASTTGQVSVFSLWLDCPRSNYSFIIPGGNHEYNDGLPFVRLVPGCVVASAFLLLNVADQFSDISLVTHMWRV